MKRKFVCSKCKHYLGEYDLTWFKTMLNSPLGSSELFCRVCGCTEFIINDNYNIDNEGIHDFTTNNDDIIPMGNDGLSHVDFLKYD